MIRRLMSLFLRPLSLVRYRTTPASGCQIGTMRLVTSESEADVILEAHADVGEGPTWDERGDVLIWVDIMGKAVHVYDPATGKDRSVDVGQPVGAAGLRQGGGLVLALQDGFGVVDSGFGNLHMIAEVEADNPGNRFNDGKVDPAGRFWAGSMAFDESRRGAGSFYRLDPDYRVTHMFGGVSISNGMDWTPDNKLMYYIDTPAGGIDVFDFDLERGEIANRRRWVSIERAEGWPDGMTLDAEGAVWVALHGSGTVRRYLPDGTLERVIRVPSAKMVTSCAFGGADLGDLYITSMSRGLSSEGLREQPLAGALFRTRPGVKGRPPFRFAG